MTHGATYRLWPLRGLLYIAALITLTTGVLPAGAQIYEWVDDTNNRHFATSLDLVPEEARAKARLVVKEGPSGASKDASISAAGAGAPSPAPARVREEEVSVDTPGGFAAGWDAGFGAGWDAGYRAAQEEQPICPAEPEVVVLESPAVINVPRYDPTGAYYVSPYEGTVSVPFDGGRSFGLTRRQQIQEQRRRERRW